MPKCAVILVCLFLAACCEPSGRGCPSRLTPEETKEVCQIAGERDASEYVACMKRHGLKP